MRKLSTLTAIVLALGLAAGPAMAQGDWDAWDANDDDVIDNEEFTTGFEDNDVFGTWDTDGDDMLTEDEFNTGVFESYVVDDSGAIEEEEFSDLGDDMGDGGIWDV